ncbi:Uncharacterised protein [Vibrio cholerae]|nr:Uncharacterised protein [Vibrio cholerae]
MTPRLQTLGKSLLGRAFSSRALLASVYRRACPQHALTWCIEKESPMAANAHYAQGSL